MGNSRRFGRQRERWVRCSDCGGMHLVSKMVTREGVEKLAMVCQVHFGHLDFDKFSCASCVDLKMGVCPGEGLSGSDCVSDCMEAKVSSVEFGGNLSA